MSVKYHLCIHLITRWAVADRLQDFRHVPACARHQRALDRPFPSYSVTVSALCFVEVIPAGHYVEAGRADYLCRRNPSRIRVLGEHMGGEEWRVSPTSWTCRDGDPEIVEDCVP